VSNVAFDFLFVRPALREWRDYARLTSTAPAARVMPAKTCWHASCMPPLVATVLPERRQEPCQQKHAGMALACLSLRGGAVALHYALGVSAGTPFIVKVPSKRMLASLAAAPRPKTNTRNRLQRAGASPPPGQRQSVSLEECIVRPLPLRGAAC
jgi:hypothetical protein